MSAFAMAQYQIAAQQPDHLRAIFPFEGLTDLYRHRAYHGGILNYLFHLHVWNLIPVRNKPQPVSFGKFTEQELHSKIRELKNNPDIQCTPYLYLIATCPQANPFIFDMLLHPYDGQYYAQGSAYSKFKDIDQPIWDPVGMRGLFIYLGHLTLMKA